MKQIDYNGGNFHISSEITTKDNKSSAGARIQILPCVVGRPVNKDEGNKKDFLSCLD